MDQIAGEEIIVPVSGSAYDSAAAPGASAPAWATAMLSNPLHLPPTRRELLEWFGTKALSLAPAYEGAVRLLHHGAFPGRVQFIAHAVRDICNRLVDVLDQQDRPKRVQYENEMDKISPDWPQLSGFSEGEMGSARSVNIPYRLAVRINSLVEAHRLRRSHPSNLALLLRYLMRMQPTQGYLNERLVRDFQRTQKWFEGQAHFRDKALPDADETDLQRQFAAFEAMLHSFVGSFFTTIERLDDVLQQANQRSD